MNYAQFVKTKEFLLELDGVCHSPNDLHRFANKIATYYKTNVIFIHLIWNGKLKPFEYYEEDLQNDCSVVKSYLESVIDNAPYGNTIESIYALSCRITQAQADDYQTLFGLVREIYHAFSGKVSFNDGIAKIASFRGRPAEAQAYFHLDKELLNGLKTKIEEYADELLSEPYANEKEDAPQVVINNNNKQVMKVDIDVDVKVETVIKQLEEACLSPDEEKQLRKTIDELKELLQSEEAKNKKWNRFKGIVSGVANFSLKAAEIIGPLMVAAWPR